jgi:hypothetical protein
VAKIAPANPPTKVASLVADAVGVAAAEVADAAPMASRAMKRAPRTKRNRATKFCRMPIPPRASHANLVARASSANLEVVAADRAARVANRSGGTST